MTGNRLRPFGQGRLPILQECPCLPLNFDDAAHTRMIGRLQTGRRPQPSARSIHAARYRGRNAKRVPKLQTVVPPGTDGRRAASAEDDRAFFHSAERGRTEFEPTDVTDATLASEWSFGASVRRLNHAPPARPAIAPWRSSGRTLESFRGGLDLLGHQLRVPPDSEKILRDQGVLEPQSHEVEPRHGLTLAAELSGTAPLVENF